LFEKPDLGGKSDFTGVLSKPKTDGLATDLIKCACIGHCPSIAQFQITAREIGKSVAPHHINAIRSRLNAAN
jgi:hypothetical protein